MDPVRQQVKEALSLLEQNVSLQGYAVVRRDGELILSELSGGFDSLSFAALSASMLGALDTLSEKLGEGKLAHAVFETEASKLVAVGGALAMLVCVIGAKADADTLLPIVKDAELRIEGILA